jgi:hypothetical protein
MVQHEEMMSIYRNRRFYNNFSAPVEKVADSDIPNRLDTIINSPDATDKDKQFALSLKSGWNKYQSLTVGQNNALKAMENRYSSDNKQKRDEWIASFDANKRGVLNICAKYYATTPYFRDIAVKVLDDPNWIPSEKQYRAMCENKYAQRMVTNMESPIKYPAGSIVEVRATFHRWDLPAGTVGMVVSVSDLVSPSRGSRKYRFLPMGEVQTQEICEKDIKIHRRK